MKSRIWIAPRKESTIWYRIFIRIKTLKIIQRWSTLLEIVKRKRSSLICKKLLRNFKKASFLTSKILKMERKGTVLLTYTGISSEILENFIWNNLKSLNARNNALSNFETKWWKISFFPSKCFNLRSNCFREKLYSS